MNKELTVDQWKNVIEMMTRIFDYIASCQGGETLEDKQRGELETLRSEVKRYREALEKSR